MANADVLKKRKTGLPAPPTDELSDNIYPRQPEPPAEYQRIDGRSLRRTGRTLQFGTRVSPAFDARLREIAQRDGLSLAEVLERALAAYDQQTSAS